MAAAAKHLLAGGLLAGALVALASASAAWADNPTVRIAKADQQKAEASLLQLHDFGVGWTGGSRKPTKLTAPKCPGFDPKESDLVVTGHADARFAYTSRGVVFEQDTQVLATSKDVVTDFSRTIQPKLAGCLAHEIEQSGKKEVTSVHVRRIPFPRFGDASAVYRAEIVLRAHGRVERFVSDFVFVGQGRMEYSLNIVAPQVESDQLGSFEQAMVNFLLRRGAGGGAPTPKAPPVKAPPQKGNVA